VIQGFVNKLTDITYIVYGKHRGSCYDGEWNNYSQYREPTCYPEIREREDNKKREGGEREEEREGERERRREKYIN
jgi:hypothetical protein